MDLAERGKKFKFLIRDRDIKFTDGSDPAAGFRSSTRFQNARTELSVRRNQRLLGPDGPATREAFAQRTPLTQAPAAVAPLLSWAEPIDITTLGGTLQTALAGTFANCPRLGQACLRHSECSTATRWCACRIRGMS